MIYPNIKLPKSLVLSRTPISQISSIYTNYAIRNTDVGMLILDRPDLYLIASILLETLSTCCLKYTLTNKRWFVPVYAGYGMAFYTFPKSLNKYSLSLSYSIWCGGGIILTTIFDKLIFKEIITSRKILSSLIILFGIVVSC